MIEDITACERGRVVETDQIKLCNDTFAIEWSGSAVASECTLHQLAPYIGKMKSTMAKSLINSFSKPNDIILDPFCGSGTIALEAWIEGRNVIANDLNPYASILTRAKIGPTITRDALVESLDTYEKLVNKRKSEVDLRKIPHWVRQFYQKETLRETITWFSVLKENNDSFIIACLLGILHHQRPGFLSYPSSHTTPYLRTKKFPKEDYPELYEYRDVRSRLEKKCIRALSRVPPLNDQIYRVISCTDATTIHSTGKVDAIITSPPYMKELDYARDNRLRLWFLGHPNWAQLNTMVSPTKTEFLDLLKRCFISWHSILKEDGLCVLVLGDSYSSIYKCRLPEAAIEIAVNQVRGYKVLSINSETIPSIRRSRRECHAVKTETVLVLKKVGRGANGAKSINGF